MSADGPSGFQMMRDVWRRHLGWRIVVGGVVAATGAYLADMLVPGLFPYTLLVLALGFALSAWLIHMFRELKATAERGHRVSEELRRLAEKREQVIVQREQRIVELEERGAEQRRVAEEREHFIAQREQLIEQLEERSAELVSFNRMVSHDLKSPLLTIKGFAGYLRRDAEKGNAGRWQEDLKRIEVAADHMSRLVEELLVYSKAGHQARPSEAVPFGDLVREALGLLAGPLTESGVEVEVAPDLPVVVGDRVRLLQITQNLLANAVKYMGEQAHPRIEVGVRCDDGQDGVTEDVLYVRDNGLGIEASDRQRVFDLFVRLDTGTEGTGVGLALVKRIIELHGGRIWVESDGAGRGSTFCLVLPGS